jgi:DNA-binding CsgD family transcriptional regulator
MRLFFTKSPCRKCDHNHLSWVSESQRKAAFTKPPNEVVGVVTCTRNGCGDDVPILSRHLREATFDYHRTQAVASNPRLRNLRLSPDLAPSIPALTERQAKVCALILEGYTGRKMARTLRVSVSTIRDEVSAAARKLAVDEPLASRPLPRQTVVAYYTVRAGSEEPEKVFQLPA